jgi:porin
VGLENDNGFKLSGSGTEGTLVPVELVGAPKVRGLPGEYRIGYYHSSDGSRGLRLFANLTLHDKKITAIDHYVQAGVVYKGLFDARPADDIGGLARVHVNPTYRRATRVKKVPCATKRPSTVGRRAPG